MSLSQGLRLSCQSLLQGGHLAGEGGASKKKFPRLYVSNIQETVGLYCLLLVWTLFLRIIWEKKSSSRILSLVWNLVIWSPSPLWSLKHMTIQACRWAFKINPLTHVPSFKRLFCSSSCDYTACILCFPKAMYFLQWLGLHVALLIHRITGYSCLQRFFGPLSSFQAQRSQAT